MEAAQDDRARTGNDLSFEVTGPVEAAEGSAPNPRRQFWQMTHATLEGPRMRASSVMPGIDWFTPGRAVTAVRMCGCPSAPTMARWY